MLSIIALDVLGSGIEMNVLYLHMLKRPFECWSPE